MRVDASECEFLALDAPVKRTARGRGRGLSFEAGVPSALRSTDRGMEFAALEANVAALGFDTSDANVRLELVAATTLSNLLAKYKRLCDVLLPALRSRNHLFNIIHRQEIPGNG